MLHRFSTLRRTLRWLRRIGHCAGFGIQSPFAYNLVTRVVYEKEAFYAYEPLARTVETAADGLRLCDARLLLRLVNDHQPRTVLVAGRRTAAAARYLQAGKPSALMRSSLSLRPDALTQAAAELAQAAGGQAPADTPTVSPATGLSPVFPGPIPVKTGPIPVAGPTVGAETASGGVDLFYVEAEAGWPAAWEALRPFATDRTLFVVHGMHRSRADRAAWQRLTADEGVRVAFDLYDFGLAYFDRRLQRARYVVNYF